MKIRYLFIVLSVTVSFSALAQGDFRPGYIIKNNRDSVPGLVDYRGMKSNAKYCFFKESKKSGKQKFSPEDLEAYGFINDKRFESKLLKVNDKLEKKFFIEVLIKGSISLYLHKDVFYIKKDALIKLTKNEEREIQTDEGRFSKENKEYVGLLNIAISDCGLSANATRYDQRELTNLIQNYNRCKGGAGLAYKRNLPWTKFDFQLFTGFSTSNLKVDGFEDDAFRISRTIIGGGSIDISSPRINSKFSFSVETWYVNNLYQGYSKSIESNGSTRNDFIINASFLKVPVGIRYNLLKENQTPYIKLGLVQYFKLTSTLKIVSEKEVNGVVTTSTDEGALSGKSQQGFWFSIGYTKNVFGRYKVFSEIRYEKTNGFLGSFLQSNSRITNLQFLLGLRF